MALKNSLTQDVHTFTVSTTKDGGTVSSTQHSTTLPTSSLDVVPSPCHNGTGGKKPGAYRYTSVKTAWPRGTWIQQYEYDHSIHQIIYEGRLGSTLGAFGWPFPPSLEDATDLRALNKLYDGIKSSEVSLNTSIGEGRETLEMMRDIAKSAIKARGRLKKLKRSLLLDPLQTVGGLYLGWSVGLSPLLNDCENIRKHMANVDNDQVRCRPITARASAYAERTSDNGNVTTDLSQRIQYGLRWRLANLHLFENWRLGLTARPTLVWELTTLSFVVDYFVNIGQYLELLEASMLNNGVEFIDGYRTFTERKTEDLHYDINTPRTGPPDTRPSTVRYELNGHQIHTFKERRVLSSFPSPPLPVIKIPRASGPLLNVAALLSQILSRRAS